MSSLASLCGFQVRIRQDKQSPELRWDADIWTENGWANASTQSLDLDTVEREVKQKIAELTAAGIKPGI